MQTLSRQETIEMSNQNRIQPSWQRGHGELVYILNRFGERLIRKLMPPETQKNTWNVKNQSWQM